MDDIKGICTQLSAIIDGMMCGSIEFTCDKLTSAMKCGHPADILDEMVGMAFVDTLPGEEPDRQHLETLLKDLKRFKRSFKVKELAAPIKALTAHLSE